MSLWRRLLIPLIVSIATVLLLMGYWAAPPLNAQTAVVTSTPLPIQAHFAGADISPFWFGITPGVSTAADVEAFINESDDIISNVRKSSYNNILDPETNYIVQGYYYFNMQVPRGDGVLEGGIGIYVYDSVVQYAYANVAQGAVSLNDIFEIFGPPDEFKMGETQIGPEIALYYTDLFVRVGVWPYWPYRTIGERRQTCTISDINGSYYVSGWTFRAPLEFHTEDLLNGVEVPQRTWEAWLRGEGSGGCFSAYRELLREMQARTATPPAAVLPSPFPTTDS